MVHLYQAQSFDVPADFRITALTVKKLPDVVLLDAAFVDCNSDISLLYNADQLRHIHCMVQPAGF